MTALDLRAAFARHYFRMPADEGDATASAGDDGEAEASGGGDTDRDEEVDNPRIKQLSDEAAKYRRERNEWRKRAEEAEAKSGDADTTKHLRLELSFERLATKARISDIEAAWRLVEDDLKAVKVEDDQVDAERLQQIVDHVVERYPYLRDDYALSSGKNEGEPSSSPSVQSGASGASGRPVNGRRQSNQNTDFGSLSKKFPALRR